MSRPYVSVIMNAYNSDQHLVETLKSLFSQTYNDWELIFWDNSSNDRCREIFKNFSDDRCHYFHHEPKVSLAQARNFAVAQAQGEWVAFLDCDDLWAPEKLMKQVTEAQENPLARLVYCRTSVFLKNKLGNNEVQGESIPAYKDKLLPSGVILPSMALHGNIISMSSAMVHRQAYHDVGGVPEYYRFAEDYYLFCALAERYSVACCQDVLMQYRIHDQSTTFQYKRLGLIESLAILKKWQSLMPLKTYLYRRGVYHTLIGLTLIRQKSFFVGLKHLMFYSNKSFLLFNGLRYGFRRFVLKRVLVS